MHVAAAFGELCTYGLVLQANAEKIKEEAALGAANIIKGAVKILTAVAVVVDREAWLKVS